MMRTALDLDAGGGYMKVHACQNSNSTCKMYVFYGM